jgi:hypothetical protein
MTDTCGAVAYSEQMDEEPARETDMRDVDTVPQNHGHRHGEPLLTDAEVTTVAAICNRLSRLRGSVDREGLFLDFGIIQAHCPLDLDALAAAEDSVFISEIMNLTEGTDRLTRSLRGTFSSRFIPGQVASGCR